MQPKTEIMDRTMRVLAILLIYLVPLSMLYGYLQGALWAFRTVAWLYFALLLLDSFFGLDKSAPELPRRHSVLWQLPLWLWAPVYAMAIVCGLLVVTQPFQIEPAPGRVFFLVSIAVGMTGGMLSVPIAHELMHRKNRFERFLAEFLMAMLSYTHFCIEHVYGHHRRVGTAKDPATARLGESFYAFYPRSVFGGVVSAWRLETGRLRRRGMPALSPRNRMLRYGATLLAIYTAIGYRFGWLGVAFFATQGVIAFSILEAINYVEHYGLTRRTRERVMPWHSWNSSHRISNWFMFNLARHSDHHCQAGRSYPELRHLDEAPQLPAGYFAMFVLALFPPLWRWVMNPLVETWRNQHEIAVIAPPARDMF